MFEIRRGLVLVACVSAGFAISAGPGLVARAAEPDRWVRAITATASTLAAPQDAAQRRIAELEQRVKELEVERRARQPGEKSSELAAAVAQNEELTARNRALAQENAELVQSRAFDRPVPTCSAFPPADEADPRMHLRYWAKQIRDGETSFRKLSPEWKSAVNLLVRGERQLDPRNPWGQL